MRKIICFLVLLLLFSFNVSADQHMEGYVDDVFDVDLHLETDTQIDTDYSDEKGTALVAIMFLVENNELREILPAEILETSEHNPQQPHSFDRPANWMLGAMMIRVDIEYDMGYGWIYTPYLEDADVSYMTTEYPPVQLDENSLRSMVEDYVNSLLSGGE